MSDAAMRPDRLAEVSRLAGELADQILIESMVAEPSPAKVLALGKAALLLEDYERPIPDMVADVLLRVHAAPGTTEASGPALDAPVGGGLAEGLAEGPAGRAGLLPRFIRSLRPRA